MSQMRCHYEVMGLARDASSEEIKKQYRKLALQHHPDKNVGQEDQATAAFKEISTAYAVLSDPQERKWYDDHRESILRGGNGTSEDDEEEHLMNLWQYFNSSCFSGFDESPVSFFTVYREVFDLIVEQEQERSSGKASSYPSFGSSTSTSEDVLHFYNQWENYVSDMNFAWADQYNVLEAPNRQVKRAMEKENQKTRDTARREWIAQVKSLVAFVKKRDPRYLAVEVERSNRKKEEEQRKLLKKAEEQRRRQEQREQRRAAQPDEEEEQRRLEERKAAFLLADNDDEEEEFDRKGRRKAVNGFDDDGDGLEADASGGGSLGPVEGLVGELSLENNAKAEDGDAEEDDEGAVEAFHCAVCSKYFKTEAQLNQHLASKVHRKKATEAQRKTKSK